MDHTAYSYYSRVSSLPFEEIFEPVDPASRNLPIEALNLKNSYTVRLRLHGCKTVNDVLQVNDADVLEMKNTGPGALREMREALLKECGVVDWHPYFQVDTVEKFLREGRKREPLDSRLWMAELYYQRMKDEYEMFGDVILKDGREGTVVDIAGGSYVIEFDGYDGLVEEKEILGPVKPDVASTTMR